MAGILRWMLPGVKNVKSGAIGHPLEVVVVSVMFLEFIHTPFLWRLFGHAHEYVSVAPEILRFPGSRPGKARFSQGRLPEAQAQGAQEAPGLCVQLKFMRGEPVKGGQGAGRVDERFVLAEVIENQGRGK